MDGCPLGLGLVVEDKSTDFSCCPVHMYVHIHTLTSHNHNIICTDIVHM